MHSKYTHVHYFTIIQQVKLLEEAAIQTTQTVI